MAWHHFCRILLVKAIHKASPDSRSRETYPASRWKDFNITLQRSLKGNNSSQVLIYNPVFSPITHFSLSSPFQKIWIFIQPHSVFSFTPSPGFHLKDSSPLNHYAFEDSIAWIDLPVIVIPTFPDEEFDFTISALQNQLDSSIYFTIFKVLLTIWSAVISSTLLSLYKGTKLYTFYPFTVIKGGSEMKQRYTYVIHLPYASTNFLPFLKPQVMCEDYLQETMQHNNSTSLDKKVISLILNSFQKNAQI